MRVEDFDVAVLGGGVAGAAAAISLASAGRRVVVVESEATPAWRIGETLAPEARPLLQALGVWEEFLATGHLPCYGVCSRWGSERVVTKDHIFNPHGSAWQLDRVAFARLLLDAARRAGARILSGASCDSVSGSGGDWWLHAGSLLLRAKVVVDATGRRAMLARSLGIKRQHADRLVSVHAQLAPPAGRIADRDARTHIESTPDGWWYSALTPVGRIVAFQTDADLLPAEQDWRREDWFLARLAANAHLSSLVPDAPARGLAAKPRLTSGHSGRLERFAGEGWFAAGDAAMSFDPLSGQGMLKAMKSGLEVAAVIDKPGDGVSYHDLCTTGWQAYRRERQRYYRDETRWPNSIFWQRRGDEMQDNRDTI